MKIRIFFRTGVSLESRGGGGRGQRQAGKRSAQPV